MPNESLISIFAMPRVDERLNKCSLASPFYFVVEGASHIGGFVVGVIAILMRVAQAGDDGIRAVASKECIKHLGNFILSKRVRPSSFFSVVNEPHDIVKEPTDALGRFNEFVLRNI